MLGRRGIWLAVAAVLLVAGSAGCTLDKGTAFEEQFTPFLEGRERLESFDLSASNDLPGYGSGTIGITLPAALDDDQIVEEVLAVAHHQVEDQIAYELVATFPTPNGAGQPVPTSLVVRVFEPMPDTDRSREIIAERVDRGRAIAAADDGLVKLAAGRSATRVTTTSDPLEVARAVGPLLAEADELGRVLVAGPEDAAADQVELPVGSSVATLEDLAAVLDLVSQSAVVTTYTAVAASDDASASLTVDLATLPADPRPLVDAAEVRDVALVLPTPAPVVPSPTPSP